MAKQSEAQQTGLFILPSVTIGNAGMPGAPIFQLSLAVNTVAKAISGHGRITQAVSPPVDVETHLSGFYVVATVMPKETRLVVRASGVPHEGAGLLNVHLRMVLSEDWKSGTASYDYRGSDGQWHAVDNVPVKIGE